MLEIPEDDDTNLGVASRASKFSYTDSFGNASVPRAGFHQVFVSSMSGQTLNNDGSALRRKARYFHISTVHWNQIKTVIYGNPESAVNTDSRKNEENKRK